MRTEFWAEGEQEQEEEQFTTEELERIRAVLGEWPTKLNLLRSVCDCVPILHTGAALRALRMTRLRRRMETRSHEPSVPHAFVREICDYAQIEEAELLTWVAAIENHDETLQHVLTDIEGYMHRVVRTLTPERQDKLLH